VPASSRRQSVTWAPMSPPVDVLVVGGSRIDDTIRGQQLPSSAHSITGDVFLRAAGGKGLNQAVAAARLGARPRLVTSVGNDAEADDVLMTLERDGIATDHVVRAAEMPTACTLTCIDACAFGHAAAALATTTRLGAVASAAAPRSR
jgi:ribokinase